MESVFTLDFTGTWEPESMAVAGEGIGNEKKKLGILWEGGFELGTSENLKWEISKLPRNTFKVQTVDKFINTYVWSC